MFLSKEKIVDSQQKMKKAFLASLSHHLRLDGVRAYLTHDEEFTQSFNISSRPHEIISDMIEEGHVTTSEIRKAVDTGLKKIGHQMYLETQKGEFPWHTTSPHALAYALHTGVLSKTEIKKIPFPHENKLHEFTRCADKLLDNVMRQLMGIDTTSIV